MSQPGHSAAVTCYQNGNYREAANHFCDILEGKGDNTQSLRNDDDKRGREEESRESCAGAGLLPVLAVEADARLCNARSVICDSNASQASRSFACQKAIDANSSYRRALCVAVDSSTEITKRRGDQHCQHLVSKALLASVSSSWIYLQMDNLELAWQVVCDTLSWAASSFQQDSNLKNIKVDKQENRPSLTTKEAIQVLTTRMVSQKTVRTVKHCFNVLNLRKGELQEPFVENNSRKAVLQNEQVKNIEKGSIVREQLVQALNFHKQLQSGRGSRDLLRLKRDASLKNAVDAEVSGVWGGNMASGVQSEIYGLDALHQKINPSDTNTEQILEKVVGPFPAYQARHNLLGCVRAKHLGKRELALDSFQQALKLEKGNAPTSEIISNAAECLLYLGQTTKSKELLLGLLKTIDEAPSGALSAPKDKLLSLCVNHWSHKLGYCDKTTILWRLFVASDLDKDPVVRTAAVEALLRNANLSGNAHVFAFGAYVYSLLESNRVACALDACKNNTERIASKSLSVMLSLYEAESTLMPKMGATVGQRTNSVGEDLDSSSVLFLAEEAAGYFDGLLTCMSNSDESMAIRAVINNNRGLAYLISGKECEALSCFQEAVRIQSRLKGPFLSLQPYFNLALLQWKKKLTNDAIKTWLSVRDLQMFHRDSNSAFELNEFHQKLDVAIQSYNDQIQVQTFRKIGGITAKQALLADIIFLQCTIQLKGEGILASCQESDLRLSQI